MSAEFAKCTPYPSRGYYSYYNTAITGWSLQPMEESIND